MRVIVLMNSLNTGGAEFSTLSLYQWLAKRGFIIKLVCLREVNPSFDPAHFGFTDIHYLNGKSFLRKVKSLVQCLKQFKPDLVHSVLFDANLLGRVCRIWLGSFIHLESLVNEMYSEHRLNDPHINRMKLNSYRALDRFTQAMGVDHFHATSKSVAMHYEEKLGISTKRITVVERGRAKNEYVGDELSRNQVRSALEISANELVLIMVGRQEFQKGYDVLLKALAGLSNEMKWTCICVGREGNSTREISKMVTGLGMDSKVKWLGHREDVMALLAASDVLVFPSRFEGLPGVLIEAEAAGLPIVCTDIRNNLEVVVEHENALLFPVDDAGKMSEQINRLMADQALRDKMRRSGMAIFYERFTWEKSHQGMHQLLVKLWKKR